LYVGDSYINHPDHRAVGYAALDAIFPAAGQPHVFEELADEGLAPHKVRKVFVISFDGGTASRTAVDISTTFDTKLAALRAHVSQLRDFDPVPMVTEWAAEAAKDCDFAYAEAYRVITLVSDEDYERLTATIAA
jgi:LmbE family N-acetylglucosaminyl deacetylase